jgi:hypothetical protein
VELPNLEGQPGWVIIVVVALFSLSSVGAAFLRKRLGRGAKHDEENPQIEGAPDTVALPRGSGTPHHLELVRESMTMMAAQAARNAEDADRAEARERELQRQLAECAEARAVLNERYAQLERELAICRATHSRMNGPGA